MDFPGGSAGKNPSATQETGLIPGLEWQPTPVLLPGKSHGQAGRLQSMESQRAGHDSVTKQDLGNFARWERCSS